MIALTRRSRPGMDCYDSISFPVDEKMAFTVMRLEDYFDHYPRRDDEPEDLLDQMIHQLEHYCERNDLDDVTYRFIENFVHNKRGLRRPSSPSRGEAGTNCFSQ